MFHPPPKQYRSGLCCYGFINCHYFIGFVLYLENLLRQEILKEKKKDAVPGTRWVCLYLLGFFRSELFFKVLIQALGIS